MDLKERIRRAAEILARVAEIPQPPPGDEEGEQIEPAQEDTNSAVTSSGAVEHGKASPGG